MRTNSRKKSPTKELVVRIKNVRLRQRLEEEVRRTGRTSEAQISAMFHDLKVSKKAARFFADRMIERFHEVEELRRERAELLKAVEKQVRQQQEKTTQIVEASVNAAHWWKAAAEKGIALCKKFEVKVGYLEMVRRQRDELIGLVERLMDGKTVHPDEVTSIYAIAEKRLLDRLIDRIEITAPPEVVPFDPPFNPDPPPPAA